ncbi:MAG: hypothetical protein KAS72_13635 [Phycisphaerales bacterium]|nr:hypothetical protein [Phycisphaerales bacterium]
MILAFLTPLQRDSLTLVGATGAVLAFAGVVVAIVRLWTTTKATKAASEASLSALRESQEKYTNHVRAQASRCLSVVHHFIQAREWRLAAARLDDLYEIAVEFGFEDVGWQGCAQRIGEMSAYFEKLAADEKDALPTAMNKKWQNLRGDLRSCIAQRGGPLAVAEKEAP